MYAYIIKYIYKLFRLKIRAEEGRVEASDLVLAGIDHQNNAD